jgi:pSer/pThr/pTyr-binding forkhead associated (FHA) protein
MTGYLIAEEGPLSGTCIVFDHDELWTIGRDPDEVNIVLEDPMVSRKHAICKLTSEGFILENLSTINPITQNGYLLSFHNSSASSSRRVS